MKTTNILLSTVLVTLLLAVVSVPSSAQTDYPAIAVKVEGPDNLAINDTAMYTITVSGGPAAVSMGWWAYDASLDMENSSGAPQIDMTSGNGTDNVFFINVTAPGAKQTMAIDVTGSSHTNAENVSLVQRFTIKVDKPVVLNADVTNNGVVSVTGIPVVFYADGVEVARTTAALAPGETKTVSANWAGHSDSQYTIEVRIDPDGEFLNSNVAGSVASAEIIVGEPSSLINLLYGAILVGVGVLTFFVVANSRNPRKRPGTPDKWRK